MQVVSLGFALLVTWRLGCPVRPVWRWCSCLGLAWFWHSTPRELALRQQDISTCSKGVWQSVLAKPRQHSAQNPLSWWEEACEPHSLQDYKIQTISDTIFSLGGICYLASSLMRSVWKFGTTACLARPQRGRCAGTGTALCHKSSALSESFWEKLMAWL